MILGARRFNEMLDELESALFPSATGMEKLKCVKNGKTIGFQVTQRRPPLV
jgi:hypothetical protein